MKQKLPAPAVIDEIIELYREFGDRQYGEDITQREHAVQVGKLAVMARQPDDVVVAAFLHDIGHLTSRDDDQMGELGSQDHEGRGAAWLLKRGFSGRVACLVEGHVAAKRYLTAVDSSYFGRLSDASKCTLEFQGGPMSDDEVARFKEDALFELHIQMRRWDEAGKDDSIDLEDTEFIRPYLARHLSAE